MKFILGLFYYVLHCTVGYFLQSRLCKRQNKHWGWILPIFSFAFSLWGVMLYMVTYTGDIPLWSYVSLVIVSFIITNLPTAIYVSLYNTHRRQREDG